MTREIGIRALMIQWRYQTPARSSGQITSASLSQVA